MNAAIKGWCPSALQPMRSGDGLLVRIRPHGGRFSAAQALGLAGLAERFGNGLIDLTIRANLQLRGVSAATHAALMQGLARLDLLDTDLDLEAQRNILASPFAAEGDDIQSLAAELDQALATRCLGLPGKFGFAVDCGAKRVLTQASADVRIERSVAGGLIVRADSAQFGCPVTRAEAAETALSLARWLVASGRVKSGRGRIVAHSRGALPVRFAGHVRPVEALPLPWPRLYPGGALVALAFGQMQAAALKFLAAGASGLRLTPWRMIFVEGLGAMPRYAGIVTSADDPILRVAACSGAPACPAALAETRELAAALAAQLAAHAQLHVSGCAKGCAHTGRSSITLVATERGFDLIRDGSVRDAPALRGLDRAAIVADPSMFAGGG
jgi:precorrin-3B synthase